MNELYTRHEEIAIDSTDQSSWPIAYAAWSAHIKNDKVRTMHRRVGFESAKRSRGQTEAREQDEAAAAAK